MFWATMCPSSGEATVFVQHLVLVILCGWLSGVQEHMLLHTRHYVPIIGRSSCVYATLGTCYSVWMTVWFAGAYASAYQTLCAHHREKQLCLCDTWYLLFCVDDCLVCRSICFCIPDTMCPSSGEAAVFVWHLVLVILCGWLSGVQGETLDGICVVK